MDLWNIGGALLGALSSGDSESSGAQSSEPWSYAQPWMRSNINAGQALQSYLQQNPFSPGQAAAYGNLFANSDYARRLTPSLIDQMSSARIFDRNNPLNRPAPFTFSAANTPSVSGGSGSVYSGLGYVNPFAGYTRPSTGAAGGSTGTALPEPIGNDRTPASTGADVSGTSLGLQGFMNGPYGIGIGMLANAFGGRQDPSAVPVSDGIALTPAQIDAARTAAEMNALSAIDNFGGFGGLSGFGGYGGVDRSGDGGLGGGEW